MKVIQNSPAQLVLKQGAISNQILGGALALGGIGLIVAGVISHKSPILYIAGAVFVLAGPFIAFTAKSDVLVADKTARQLKITYTSLKNKAGQTQQCSFDDVSSVQLQQEYRQQFVQNGAGNNQPGISFGTPQNGQTTTTLEMTLTILLKNGTTWKVATSQKQVNMGLGISSGGNLSQQGQLLADTLGVQFQVLGAQTPGQAIRAVQQAVTQQTVAPASVTPVVATPVTPAPINPVTPVNPADPTTPTVG